MIDVLSLKHVTCVIIKQHKIKGRYISISDKYESILNIKKKSLNKNLSKINTGLLENTSYLKTAAQQCEITERHEVFVGKTL